ncbi:uncharacterized protein Dvar_51400 [Desulfosarcina variabilis str. Montpellier]
MILIAFLKDCLFNAHCLAITNILICEYCNITATALNIFFWFTHLCHLINQYSVKAPTHFVCFSFQTFFLTGILPGEPIYPIFPIIHNLHLRKLFGHHAPKQFLFCINKTPICETCSLKTKNFPGTEPKTQTKGYEKSEKRSLCNTNL